MPVNPYFIQRRIKEVSPAIPGRPARIPERRPTARPTEVTAERRPIDIPFTERVAYGADVIPLSRPPKSFAFTIGTTPVKIIEPPHIWPYMVFNPSLAVGTTASYTLYSGTASGNGESSSMGVANYLKAHWHLNVTDVSGSWDFYMQSLDPGSNTWADTQVIFSGVSETGTLYASTDAYGLVTDTRVRWEGSGSITFSITVTLKEGTAGSSTGLSRVIFLGGDDVSPDTGMPLLEGQSRVILPGPDVSIWAVSYSEVPLRVFVL